MNKKYISPSSMPIELDAGNEIMRSSGPSFDVDKNKDSGVLLSNKQDDYAWAESNWSGFEED